MLTLEIKIQIIIFHNYIASFWAMKASIFNPS